MIELSIESIRLDTVTKQPVLILRDMAGDRFLPIWIGTYEATAIAMQLEGMKSPRPMTHDLMIKLLEGLDGSIASVSILDMVEGVYYARISLATGDGTIDLDARPSDAIALALRAGCPIYAGEELANEMLSIAGDEQNLGSESAEAEEFRRFLEDIKPADFQ
ncbi:MAG: bifunctional nuclease family protein [bacterium]|nr:bifunctional nuclease family protein [bacterium]